MRRCCGFTRNFRRCGRQGNWKLFCDDHRFQPIVIVFTVLAGAASIQSAWFPHLWNKPNPQIKISLRQMVLDSAYMPTAVRIQMENHGSEARAEGTDIIYLMNRNEYSPQTRSQTQLEEKLWKNMLNGVWKPAVIPATTSVTIPLDTFGRNHVGPDGKPMNPDLVHQLIRDGWLLYFIGAGRDQKSKKLLWQFCFYYNKDYSTVWTMCSAGHN